MRGALHRHFDSLKLGIQAILTVAFGRDKVEHVISVALYHGLGSIQTLKSRIPAVDFAAYHRGDSKIY